ncbi:unnamed protein product [Closterium sp. NIES-65]|nr:unnamed protein product [Closterium sp. NIES-65]
MAAVPLCSDLFSLQPLNNFLLRTSLPCFPSIPTHRPLLPAVANVTLTSITLHKHINWVFLPQVFLLCTDSNHSDLFSQPLNFFLLTPLSCFPHPPPPRLAAVANVTLTSITLHKHINWVFLPQVFLLCADGNRSDLPFSPPLNIQVNLTGKEDWQLLFLMNSGGCKSCGIYEKSGSQTAPFSPLPALPLCLCPYLLYLPFFCRLPPTSQPLFQMDSGGCKSCGIYEKGWIPLFQMDSGGCKSCGMYEKGWIADSPYLLFPLCESNFSAPKGHSPAPGAAGFGELLLADPKGTVEFVLSCPACVRDLEMSTGDGDVHTAPAPQGLGVVVWVIAGVAVMGVLVLLITSVVYITKGGDQILDESERDKFLEMGATSSEEPLYALGREPRLASDVLKGDPDDYL